MKKRALFLVILFVFLVGCSYISSTLPGVGQKEPSQEQQVPRGIAVSFVPGFPAKKVIEGIPFDVKLKVINYGARDVSVDLKLSDSLTDSYGGITAGGSSKTVELEGNEGLPNAGFDEIEKIFNIEPYQDVKKGMKTGFEVEASYDYDYVSMTQICVNGFAQSSSRPKKCAVSEIISRRALDIDPKESDAMRSPVAVTSVEKTSSATEDGTASVTLDISIENVGGGFLEDGVINVKEVSLSDFEITCDKPFTDLKIKTNEKKMITCTARGTVGGTHVIPTLIVSYDYNYIVMNSYGPVEIVEREK